MKRLLFAFLFSLITILSVVTIVLDVENDYTDQQKNEANDAVEYKMMDYNGKIAIFKENSDVPVKIYNIYSESLPESDRKLLKEGITCSDDAELRRLIEDYTS